MSVIRTQAIAGLAAGSLLVLSAFLQIPQFLGISVGHFIVFECLLIFSFLNGIYIVMQAQRIIYKLGSGLRLKRKVSDYEAQLTLLNQENLSLKKKAIELDKNVIGLNRLWGQSIEKSHSLKKQMDILKEKMRIDRKRFEQKKKSYEMKIHQMQNQIDSQKIDWEMTEETHNGWLKEL